MAKKKPPKLRTRHMGIKVVPNKKKNKSEKAADKTYQDEYYQSHGLNEWEYKEDIDK